MVLGTKFFNLMALVLTIKCTNILVISNLIEQRDAKLVFLLLLKLIQLNIRLWQRFWFWAQELPDTRLRLF